MNKNDVIKIYKKINYYHDRNGQKWVMGENLNHNKNLNRVFEANQTYEIELRYPLNHRNPHDEVSDSTNKGYIVSISNTKQKQNCKWIN